MSFAPAPDPHPSAVDLLRRVRACFVTATAALARVCAVDGKLDAAALDRQQVGSYDLAWVSADLLAAETLLASLTTGSTGVDRRLALVYAAEAVGSCLSRLESLHLCCPCPPCRRQPNCASLIRQHRHTSISACRH